MRDGLLLDDVFGKKENRPAVRAAHQLIKCAEDAAPSEREVILAEEIAKNPRRRAALNYESGLPMCAELNAPANRSGDRETIARSMRHDAVRLGVQRRGRVRRAGVACGVRQAALDLRALRDAGVVTLNVGDDRRRAHFSMRPVPVRARARVLSLPHPH